VKGGGGQVKVGHNSHVNDVLNIEVLQWSQVRVYTSFILKYNLLEDAIQELPLLEVTAIPLV
jgi:hypothetical protein